MSSKQSREPKDWAKVYATQRPLYENFTLKLTELIKDLLLTHKIEVAQIESRTKTIESFQKRLVERGRIIVTPFSN